MNDRTPAPSARARWIRWLIAAVIVTGLATLALWPSSRLVDHAEVAQGSVQESFEAEGRTRIRDRYVISAPLAARVERTTWEPGDVVTAGQVVLTLHPLTSPALDARTHRQAQAQAEAARQLVEATRAEAQAAAQAAQLAASEATRMERLAEQGMVSREALERALSQRERSALEAQSARFREATARHQWTAAQAALQAEEPDAATRLRPIALRAPVDGVILKRHVQSERPVQPGEALLEIGNPHALEVEVDVLSTDAVRLRPGMRVALLRWGGTPALQGEVRRIEPQAFTKVSALGVEEQRVWVVIDLLQPAQDGTGLGEGFRVHARFVLRESADTLHLPAGAVFRSGSGGAESGWAVFRIDNGRARLQPVEIGLQGEGRVEIISGLQAQDRVVLHPSRDLADGSRVHHP